MCLSVYVASDDELQPIKWIEDRPAFNIRDLEQWNSEVRRQFSLPFVAYAGSHAGCGCGFIREGTAYPELVEVEENYFKLATYLSELRDKGASIQIFSCWGGDEGHKRDFNYQISISQLLEKEFEFQERAFYEIK
ncbi:MAG TPA: hypothetical protein VEV84_06585 [Pyrinomonadaceae bacterium]|nr:hypothetical protein [Pyrinomonadaceae bacterium]